MKIAVLFSGGKDSAFSLHRALEQGREVVVLIAMKSKNPYSYMFHIPNIDLVEMQADALKIPIMVKKTPGIKEKELKELKQALTQAKRKYKIEGVVSGAVASEYQRYRIEAVCADVGLKSIAPLWHLDPERYLTEMIKSGFKIIITAVAAEGFDDTWLGKELDMTVLEELKKLRDRYGTHISGEGGEYETIVIDGPIFKKRVEIVDAEKKWDGQAGQYIIKDVRVINK